MKNNFCIILIVVLFSACKPNTTQKNIDVAPLLKTVGENIILPNYSSLETDVIALDDAILVLKNTPTANNLNDTKEKFLTAYKAWQNCSPFQFGPAVDQALNTLNIYPTDTSQIRSNISSGTYNLDAASNFDASGFPTLDYLLFHNNETAVLNDLFTASYSNYMVSVSNHIKTKVSAVKSSWQTSYLSSFTQNTELSVGSSMSLLTNAMILNFEKNAREAKIGIPAGVRTLNQIVPENIEALYSKNSVLLAKEHLIGFKELFEGKNGDSYYNILVNIDEQELADKIKNQLIEIQSALNILTDPFDVMLENDNEPALNAYDEYQKMLPLLKVDMTAAFGLLISYSDSDGD